MLDAVKLLCKGQSSRELIHEIAAGQIGNDDPRRYDAELSDIIYFPVSKWGTYVHHHALFESLDDGVALTTIDGNTRRSERYPQGIVDRRTRDVRIYPEPPRCVSIGPLLERAK